MIKSIFYHNPEAKVNLLTNRVANSREAEQVAGRIKQVCNQFIGKEIHWLGYVLDDAKVSLAVKNQQPFSLAYPRCAANQCLQKIAEKIACQQFTDKVNQEKRNFFQRLFTFWS